MTRIQRDVFLNPGNLETNQKLLLDSNDWGSANATVTYILVCGFSKMKEICNYRGRFLIKYCSLTPFGLPILGLGWYFLLLQSNKCRSGVVCCTCMMYQLHFILLWFVGSADLFCRVKTVYILFVVGHKPCIHTHTHWLGLCITKMKM